MEPLPDPERVRSLDAFATDMTRLITRAAITVGLLDPAMDRRSTRFELARQILNAAPGSRTCNDLFLNSGGYAFLVLGMMTLSSHNSECVHQTGGTP